MILLLLSLAGPAAAGAQESYDQGVVALRAGQADAAVERFASALDQGAVDPAVYHGLGNALYRQGHPGHAIAAWTRGLELDPTDSELAANRRYAQSRTEDRLDPPDEVTGPFFWQALVSAADEARAAGLLVALGLLVQLVAGILRRRAGRSLRPRWEAAALVIAGLVLGLSAFLHARRLPPTVVLAEEVRARSALGAEGVELFVLHRGALVRTVERYAGQDPDEAAVLVELPDARKGWLPASAVDLTDPASPFPLPSSEVPALPPG